MVAVEVPDVTVMLKGPDLVVLGRVAFHWQVLLPGSEKGTGLNPQPQNMYFTGLNNGVVL